MGLIQCLRTPCPGQSLYEIYKEIRRCQYLNTGVVNVDTGRSFWKKEGAKPSTFVKNVEIQTCGSCFRASPSGKAAKEVIPAQLERAA